MSEIYKAMKALHAKRVEEHGTGAVPKRMYLSAEAYDAIRQHVEGTPAKYNGTELIRDERIREAGACTFMWVLPKTAEPRIVANGHMGPEPLALTKQPDGTWKAEE